MSDKSLLDAQIAQILVKEKIDKANQLLKFCNPTATFPLQKMWKLKKKTVVAKETINPSYWKA